MLKHKTNFKKANQMKDQILWKITESSDYFKLIDSLFEERVSYNLICIQKEDILSLKKKKLQFLANYFTHSYSMSDVQTKKYGNLLAPPPSGLKMNIDIDNNKSALSSMVSHASYSDDVKWSRSSKEDHNLDNENNDNWNNG